LENPFPTQLFAPRCPKLTTKSICEQEKELTITSFLDVDAVPFRKERDCVAVDRSIEVHGSLHSKNGR